MVRTLDLTPCYPVSDSLRDLQDFTPPVVDRAYLQSLGVRVDPSDETLEALLRGSALFRARLGGKTLFPAQRCRLEAIDPEEVETEIHNYTGRCPTLTYELNPVRGCGIGCQYCLVTDGVHEQPLVALENYPEYVARLLEREMVRTARMTGITITSLRKPRPCRKRRCRLASRTASCGHSLRI